MNMFVKKTGYLILLVACVLPLSGCWALVVGAAAGAGGYAWYSGVLEKEYMEPAVRVQDAVERALKDLGLPPMSVDRDRLTGRFRSAFNDGQKLTVEVDAMTEKSSRLRIRVGFFGNRLRSEMVMKVIEKFL